MKIPQVMKGLIEFYKKYKEYIRVDALMYLSFIIMAILLLIFL